MSTQTERTEATRRALLDAGRELFAEQGFAETSTEAVVRRAGVTRGALYHHFKDKTDLFAAVFEDLEAGLVERLAASVPATDDPFALLEHGVTVFLDGCLDPAVRRIAMLEGPTILGWERWVEVERRYGLGILQTALQVAADTGVMRPLPVEALAHLLLGALVEAAMLLASSDDPARTRLDLEVSATAILAGLRA